MKKIQAVFLLLFLCSSAFAQEPKHAAGKWLLQSSTSKMDDTRTSVLMLPANEEVNAWPRPVRPVLVVGCGTGHLVVSVETVAPVKVERGDQASVRLRLGAEAPISEEWSKNDKGVMLFSNSGESLVRALAKSERLLFEFTPFNSTPAVAEFDVRELAPNLKQLESNGCLITMAPENGPAVIIRGFSIPAPKGARVNEITPQMNHVIVGFSKSELTDYYQKAMTTAGWQKADGDCWTNGTNGIEHKLCITPRDGYINVEIVK